MLNFDVSAMSCGHCVAAVTRAVQAVVPQARVDVALAERRVAVDADPAQAPAIARAISEAGYPATVRPA